MYRPLNLLQFQVPPIRIARFVVRYENKIVQPYNNGLSFKGGKIKINVAPMAFGWAAG